MDRLPPELMISITELIAPPAYLTSYRERYAVLRVLALISKRWRAVAQGLLFQTVILHFAKDSPPIPVQIKQLALSIENGSREVTQLRISSHRSASFKTFSNQANLMGQTAASLFRNEAMSALRSLVLSGVYFDPNLLTALKNLEVLRLFKVIFRGTTTTESLPKLTLLQMHSCIYLPTFLLPAQLPSLNAVAIDNCTTLREVIQTLLALPEPPFPLLSLSWDVLYRPPNNAQILPDFVLVDVPGIDFIRTDDNQEPSPFRAAFRNIRMLSTRGKDSDVETFWNFRLHDCCSYLETIVVPSNCKSLVDDPESPISRYSQRHNVKILIEEESMEGNEEMDRQLSKAFMKYRHIPFGWR